MKTKANTLIEDGQDINANSVKTDSIIASDSRNLIKYVVGSRELQIGEQSVTEYLSLFAIQEISFNNVYGSVMLGDVGFTISASNGMALSNTPFYFSDYSTASRPTGINEGAVIYDSTLKKCILYNGTAWVNLDGTALS